MQILTKEIVFCPAQFRAALQGGDMTFVALNGEEVLGKVAWAPCAPKK